MYQRKKTPQVLFSFSVALMAAMLVAGMIHARPSFARNRTHTIVPEDYFTLVFPVTGVLSPQGDRLVYTELRWDEEEDKRNTDLWVVDVRSRSVRRLTFDPATDSAPQWSPDGKWVYFTSSRKQGEEKKPPYNGKRQVWRVSVESGEIVPVTRLTKGVKAYNLSHDGNSLYFTTGSEQVDKDEWEDLRNDFKKLEYGHGITTFSELWILNLETWRSEKLIDEERVITAFTVSADQRRLAMITKPDETLLSGEGWSRVDVCDLETKSITSLDDRLWREEAPSPYGWIINPTFSSDGDVLAFRVDFDGYPGEVFFAHFDGPDDQPLLQKMVRPGEVTVEGGMKWIPGGRTFCFTADDHARRRVYGMENLRGGKAGRPVTLTPGDVVVDDYSFSESGRSMAVLMSGLDHPPDFFSVDNPGTKARFSRITKLNPQVDTWRIPQIQIAKWTSPDGTPVEGILELPPGHDPETGGSLPLVVAIHGGPTSCSKYRFRFWIYGRTAFAAQGWALLDVNYRGSTGYGDKFLIDLIGNKNNLDVADILSGVDALIERGVVDPERMAVMGWSNGGYLTNCIITKDNRFKAASSGAGVFDTAMQWSIEDTPGHVINYSQGLPWEQPAKMRSTSPLYNADKIKTPTLIHVGENDERVPQEHSRSLYRALKHYLHVPAELIIYPGEGHGLTKFSHRKAKLLWDAKWFNHHVLGKVDEDME